MWTLANEIMSDTSVTLDTNKSIHLRNIKKKLYTLNELFFFIIMIAICNCPGRWKMSGFTCIIEFELDRIWITEFYCTWIDIKRIEFNGNAYICITLDRFVDFKPFSSPLTFKGNNYAIWINLQGKWLSIPCRQPHYFRQCILSHVPCQ